MDKYKQIKRNHHYVWSFYLRSWATGNDLFYISKKGKIARDSVKGLAKETDFYKISLLNDEDVEFIKSISSKSPIFLQEIHMSQLSSFDESPEEASYFAKVIQHNSLENLHSIIEGTAVEVISKLAIGEVDCLHKKENMIAFCSYVGHQMSRTKSFKEKSMAALISANLVAATHPKYLELFEKNWWFLSYMFGINIGCSLYESKDRDNHIFMRNNTELPFITSDNPIINVHYSLESISERLAPESADFYIPLSPKYAYMINNSSDFDRLSAAVEIDNVMFFNEEIADKSYGTVFGSSEAALKAHNE